MKAVIWSLGFVVLLASSPRSVLAAPAPQTATKPSDNTLDERIEHRVKADATLKKLDIHVSVRDGVATLSGSVATDAERARAERLAKIRWITRVDNQIVVDPSAAKKGTVGKLEDKTKEAVGKTKDTAKTVADKTKDTAITAADRTKDTAITVSDKTKEGVSKTGEVITDAWITGRVHTGFIGEDSLKGSDIDVDTSNHVVTLKGTVAAAAGRARAVEIARKVEGVHHVVDQLVIAPKKD